MWVGSTDRHLLLREAEHAILVVHLEKMKAARFASRHFKDLHIADFIPPDDTFLFSDLQNPLPRAELSEEKSAFACCYFFQEHHQKLGLCPSNNTLMVGLGPKAALYDFASNRISSPFSWGRVIGTRPARNWYIYDYCKETRTVTLRDVTGELSTLLEWEEPETPLHGRPERNPDWHVKLHHQVYFGFKGEEILEEPPSGEEQSVKG